MNTFDYPIGADTADAPWNQVENKPIETELELSITVKRVITTKTTSYTRDKEGIEFFEDIVVDEFLDSSDYSEIIDYLREEGWSIEDTNLELY